MNQKVSTSIGTGILVIMAFTAGYFVWMVEKSNQLVTTPEFILENRATEPSYELRKKSTGGTIESKIETDEPTWLVYEDSDIRFQYPKTFCGTSWQEEWDVHSCDEDWVVERTESSMGALIKIMPSYSSYGFEFGGDVEISFMSKNKFTEVTENKRLEEVASKGDYQVYLESGQGEYAGRMMNAYFSNGIQYLEVGNSFPNKYPRYFSFLVDSIILK